MVISCCDPRGTLDGDTQTDHFLDSGGSPLDGRESKPASNEVRISASIPTSESNQQKSSNLKSIPRTHLLELLCGSKSWINVRKIKAILLSLYKAAARGGGPVIMTMYFWNLHNILADPHVAPKDESKRFKKGSGIRDGVSSPHTLSSKYLYGLYILVFLG